jgi:23S rRNA (adenine2503-C2)-methyltransferase
LPKAIERLAEQLDLPVTLALSLHAPNDELRRELIPWAEYTTISDLLASCQKWFEKTGREITLEYTLLRGVNDRPQHAAELAKLAKTLRANVNVIRYNEVAGTPFARPLDQDVRAFQAALRDKNINAHIRASRGRDIAAACGQLRHETGNKARAKVAEGSQG